MAAVVEREVVEALGGMPARIAESTEDLDRALATRRPRQGGWAVVEVVCHMRDQAEILHSLLGRALREEGAHIIEYDDAEMAASREYIAQDLGMVVSALRAIRSRTMESVRRLSDADLARAIVRPDGASVALATVLRQWVEHEAAHLDEIARLRRALLPQAAG